MRHEVLVAREEVSAECGRRIKLRYSLEQQLNAGRGSDEVDFAWIDAMRARYREIAAMTPIPHDFANNKWWTL